MSLGPIARSAASVSCGTPIPAHHAATIAASSTAAARRPWSTVAAITRPGRAAWPCSRSAMLSAPPDTASARTSPPASGRPETLARSARKRSTSIGGSGRARTPVTRGRAPGSPALRLGAACRQGGLHLGAQLGAVFLHLVIDLADIGRRLVERAERFGEVHQALRRAIAVGELLVAFIEGQRRERGLAVVEIGTTEQVLRIAGALVLGILRDHLLQLRLRLGVEPRLELAIAIGIGVLRRIAGVGLLDRGEPRAARPTTRPT